MINRFFLILNTVKYLKYIQIYYRIFYFFRKKIYQILSFTYPLQRKSFPQTLILQDSINSYKRYFVDKEFIFLNRSKQFPSNIDWNYQGYGKLWTYNLNYFEFLNQEDINCTVAIELIDNFIKKSDNIIIGFEPYPIALRGINWIKFFTYNNISNQEFNDSLYAQYYQLYNNIEYHLLGNHLLEDAFSLLFGSYYFQNDTFYKKSKYLLEYELNEQILLDGGHFELTPMYHQIIFFRLLDAINLLQNNKWKKDGLLLFLEEKASFMLAWLKNMTYSNGSVPHFNDTTNGIAPTSKELFDYSKRLQIYEKSIELNESGYQKRYGINYECFVDIGEIGARYIPGHAHSDTFSFELYYNNKPFIVDTGLSTYESNERRMIERSSSSHNTVEVNSKNQSQVWGGFRVANRAEIITKKITKNSIEATHNGYIKEKILHTRRWEFQDNIIIITDSLSQKCKAIAYLHFHPTVTKEEIEEKISIENTKYKLDQYEYSLAFNKLETAYMLSIYFSKILKVSIKL